MFSETAGTPEKNNRQCETMVVNSTKKSHVVDAPQCILLGISHIYIYRKKKNIGYQILEIRRKPRTCGTDDHSHPFRPNSNPSSLPLGTSPAAAPSSAQLALRGHHRAVGLCLDGDITPSATKPGENGSIMINIHIYIYIYSNLYIVSTSFLFLVVRHLLLKAMHLFLVAYCLYIYIITTWWWLSFGTFGQNHKRRGLKKNRQPKPLG